MILPLVALLLLAILAGGLVVFAAWRDACSRTSRQAALSVARLPQKLMAFQKMCTASTLALSAASAARTRTWCVAHRWMILSCGLALILPVVIASLWAGSRPLAGFEERIEASDPVIAAVLEGEHLVPPPPLPPEVFLTQEVQAERPEIATASRDWALLDASFEQRLLHVFRQMRERGYELVLLEGYRSPARQARLAAMGPHVTRAGPMQSYHQYGLAADVAFLRDGRVVISERDAWAMSGYQLLGTEAENIGLTWGGRWKLKDLGHVELHRAGTLPKQTEPSGAPAVIREDPAL